MNARLLMTVTRHKVLRTVRSMIDSDHAQNQYNYSNMISDLVFNWQLGSSATRHEYYVYRCSP